MRKKWPHFHNLTLPLDIPYLVVAIDRPKVHNSAINGKSSTRLLAYDYYS